MAFFSQQHWATGSVGGKFFSFWCQKETNLEERLWKIGAAFIFFCFVSTGRFGKLELNFEMTCLWEVLWAKINTERFWSQERSKKSLQQFEHLAELLEMPFMYKDARGKKKGWDWPEKLKYQKISCDQVIFLEQCKNTLVGIYIYIPYKYIYKDLDYKGVYSSPQIIRMIRSHCDFFSGSLTNTNHNRMINVRDFLN